MEQTEISFHILYFLVTVIVTCETRFRHLGQTYNNGGHYNNYGYGPTSSESQRVKTYNERYPKNIQFNEAPFSGGYFPGSYTNQLPVNTGRLVGNRGFQTEISPYSSHQVPPGRYMSTYPPEFTQTVNNDGESVLYDKSLFVSPGMGHVNPNKIPEKLRIDHRYSLYDGSQVVYPYDEQNIISVRTPLHNKFKRPSSSKANIHRAPHGGSSGWSIKRHAANREESLAYDGYLGFRSFRDNPTVHERGDLTAQDNFVPYNSIPYGDQTNYLIVKKRISADYAQ